MNELLKRKMEKINENGDKSFNSTGNELLDLYFMADYFAAHLDEVKVPMTPEGVLLSMYMRDPRLGQGRKDLGRKMCECLEVLPELVVATGRFDDLWRNPTDANLSYLKCELDKGNTLAKKWMPRLTGANKEIAKLLCKHWGLSERKYRNLIKCEDTVEYKLSYCEEKDKQSNLDRIFKKREYIHPLVESINFEHVPSNAMVKYANIFNNREDIAPAFKEYLAALKEGKKKVNTSTTTVVDAKKLVDNVEGDVSEVIGEKIIATNIEGVSLNAIVILDTSGSMRCGLENKTPYNAALAIAHSLSRCSTYCPNQIISFSNRPKLMTIKGETLKEQYASMHTGDCSNTNFAAVMELLKNIKTEGIDFPEYLVVLSDMEFDEGSWTSKEETMQMFKEAGIPTRIIWWNLNSRNKTVPERDEYGNLFISGQDLLALKLVEGTDSAVEFLNSVLKDYEKKLFSKFDKK